MSKDRAGKILVVDDNLPGIAWLEEYLEAKGLDVVVETSFGEALKQLRMKPRSFDLVTVDLMLPVPDSDLPSFEGKPPLYKEFPGLLLALTARNFGYPTNSVLLYSVHDTPEIEAEAKRIGVKYTVKGRPRDLKATISQTFKGI